VTQAALIDLAQVLTQAEGALLRGEVHGVLSARSIGACESLRLFTTQLRDEGVELIAPNMHSISSCEPHPQHTFGASTTQTPSTTNDQDLSDVFLAHKRRPPWRSERKRLEQVGYDALRTAAALGLDAVVHRLLSGSTAVGVDLNPDGPSHKRGHNAVGTETPLQVAARRVQPSTCQVLLAHGARPMTTSATRGIPCVQLIDTMPDAQREPERHRQGIELLGQLFRAMAAPERELDSCVTHEPTSAVTTSDSTRFSTLLKIKDRRKQTFLHHAARRGDVATLHVVLDLLPPPLEKLDGAGSRPRNGVPSGHPKCLRYLTLNARDR
jgi:hypothetical protein